MRTDSLVSGHVVFFLKCIHLNSVKNLFSFKSLESPPTLVSSVPRLLQPLGPTTVSPGPPTVAGTFISTYLSPRPLTSVTPFFFSQTPDSPSLLIGEMQVRDGLWTDIRCLWSELDSPTFLVPRTPVGPKSLSSISGEVSSPPRSSVSRAITSPSQTSTPPHFPSPTRLERVLFPVHHWLLDLPNQTSPLAPSVNPPCRTTVLQRVSKLVLAVAPVPRLEKTSTFPLGRTRGPYPSRKTGRRTGRRGSLVVCTCECLAFHPNTNKQLKVVVHSPTGPLSREVETGLEPKFDTPTRVVNILVFFFCRRQSLLGKPDFVSWKRGRSNRTNSAPVDSHL